MGRRRRVIPQLRRRLFISLLRLRMFTRLFLDEPISDRAQYNPKHQSIEKSSHNLVLIGSKQSRCMAIIGQIGFGAVPGGSPPAPSPRPRHK
jgi:hypothetical protein